MSDYMTIYNNPKLVQGNYNNYPCPNFKSNPAGNPNLTQTDKDVVEISSKKQKKKGMSKTAQWLLGIGGTIAACIAAITIRSKITCSQLEKIYKEKLVPKDLGEHIDFKAAKTLEDAIKFTKEKLGITEIDKSFTLDALNYVNEHIVTVSNKYKGKLYMPTALRFNSMDKTIASVCNNVKSERFCELTINKDYFDDEYLTKRIKNILGNIDSNGKNLSTGEKTTKKYAYQNHLDNEYWALINKFKADEKSLTIAEKRKLLFTNTYGKDMAFREQTGDKMAMLEKIEKALQDKGQTLNIDKQAFEKLKCKEQEEKIANLLTDNNLMYEIVVPTNDGAKTIYHELIHLQDFGKNLKDLDIKKQNLLQQLKDVWNKKTDGTPIDYLSNHWGGSTYKGFKELLEKNPEKFKKRYPDLYEHLTNDEIQKTAGKVSSYAQTSIGEFIADTGAKMIKGDRIPDDVMALYKKYNGPMLPS